MASASKENASEQVSMDGFEGRFEELGGYTVGFETHTADADAAELFKGLPDDRCQCPHWGYVVSGKVALHFADRVETYREGDAYYAPPGHTPEFFDGTELVEFSPSDALDETVTVVMSNLRAAGAEV